MKSNNTHIVYTIGYDGRSIEEFLEILKYFGIERIIDVRRWNKSVKRPIYSGGSLREILGRHGIDYHWLPDLGGYRKFGVDIEDYGIANCFKSRG